MQVSDGIESTQMHLQVDNEAAKHYEVERHALFFNDTGAKELYQDYVRYIVQVRFWSDLLILRAGADCQDTGNRWTPPVDGAVGCVQQPFGYRDETASGPTLCSADGCLLLLQRRNSRTGQLYRDDPTILAWDLINEPRCETWRVRLCQPQLQSTTNGLRH